MPSIIMTKLGGRLDASVKKKAYAFLEKLAENDALPGLHVEPIADSVDPRVRTGRVDDSFRAVLFRIPGTESATYVFHGIWPHDEAIAVARRTRLSVNPVNGIAEIHTVQPSAPVDTPAPHPGPRDFTSPVTSPAPAEPATAPAQAGPEIPDMAGEQGRPETIPLLVRRGVASSDLTQALGIGADLARTAMTAADEDALLEIAERAVEWQGCALLDLASGHSVEDVIARLAIDTGPGDTSTGTEDTTSEDEQLLRGLSHPAARMSFTYIDDDAELRRVIDGGDFDAWRVFLHPEQARYAQRSYNGPFRLSGGAGTGKTVVVLHRARALARREPEARIVLTTFTTNLADALRENLRRLDPDLPIAAGLGQPGIFVAGIDAIASAALRNAGDDLDVDVQAVLGMGSVLRGGRNPGGDLWRDALDAAGANLPEHLRSPAFLAAEYSAVVLPQTITTREQYLRVRRPGRGVALDRAKRSAVWDVVDAYRARARVDGRIDFAEAATIAAVHLRRTGQERQEFVADHVLVDEGQDLSPAHWQLLRALVAEHRDDLFIAEDSHQRIYGQRVTLSRYGIRVVGRSHRLRLNYRTTAQNLAFALGILDGGAYVDLEEAPETHGDYRSARSGPRPRVLACTTLSGELDRAAQQLRTWLADAPAPETIAVLVRDRRQRERVIAGLAERGVTVRAVDRDVIKPGAPVVMTMHRAKGTEFTHVLLFGVTRDAIPSSLRDQQYDDTAREDALLRERSLLYVAATRARDHLVVSWNGQSSELLGRTLP